MQARNGLQQLPLAGTGDAGDAQDLTAQSGEGDVVQPLYALAVVAGDALQGQAGDGSVVLGAVDVQGHAVAHHHIRQGLRIRLGGLDGADVLALAEDGHLVGQGHDLVELVGDDDDGLAVGLHVPQDGEELLRLLRGQHGGGLVQNEDIRPTVQDLDDLHRLLLGDGHIVDLLSGVDVEAVAVADLLDLGVGGLDVQAAALVQTQHDVLGGGEHVHQLIVLMDHADAVLEGILGGADGYGLPLYQDLALVREIDAGQHIHQGGLTAAVLPQQGEDLTTVQGQIDAIVGDDAAETFGDVSQLNGANSFQGCHPFVVNWGAAAPVRFPDNI